MKNRISKVPDKIFIDHQLNERGIEVNDIFDGEVKHALYTNMIKKVKYLNDGVICINGSRKKGIHKKK